MGKTRAYDLVIIGGGPGGYVAALRAAQFDMSVALVEERKVGGTCLNRGCIPSKALLYTAHVLETCEKAARFGVSIDGFSIDVDAVRRHKERSVKQLVSGVETLLAKAGVEVLSGHGRFVTDHEIAVTRGDQTTRVEGEKVIVATGSLPALDHFEGTRGRNVWTSDVALDLPHVPESVIIIGSGATGMELAAIYLHFGSKVTVTEMYDRALPREDRDASEVVTRTFQRRGGRIETRARVQRIEDAAAGKRVIFTREGEEAHLEAEVVILAAGRVANLDDLGAEEIGLDIERQGICVREGVDTPAADASRPPESMCPGVQLRTSIDHIYAIGDCIRGIGLAHVAMHEGVAAVEAMSGLESFIDYNAVPTALYCHPEIATVGLTEDRARELGVQVSVGMFPFAANGRAVCTGSREGFAKIVADPHTGRVLGATACGTYTTEIIPELTLAVQEGLSVDEIINVMHAHPTLGEAVHEAALATQNRPLHIPFR
ncbi:MAG: NAD(P)/FAD-dependent oxidoreductase [Armatimonadota bacterium]